MSRVQTLLIKLEAVSAGFSANGYQFEAKFKHREADRLMREKIQCWKNQYMEDPGTYSSYSRFFNDNEDMEYWWNESIVAENKYWSDLHSICVDMKRLVNNFGSALDNELNVLQEDDDPGHFARIQFWIEHPITVAKANVESLLEMTLSCTVLNNKMSRMDLIQDLFEQDFKSDEFYHKFIECHSIVQNLFLMGKPYLESYYMNL